MKPIEYKYLKEKELKEKYCPHQHLCVGWFGKTAYICEKSSLTRDAFLIGDERCTLNDWEQCTFNK